MRSLEHCIFLNVTGPRDLRVDELGDSFGGDFYDEEKEDYDGLGE